MGILIHWASKPASLTTRVTEASTQHHSFLRKSGRSWAILLSLTSRLVDTARTFRILTSSSAWVSAVLRQVRLPQVLQVRLPQVLQLRHRLQVLHHRQTNLLLLARLAS